MRPKQIGDYIRKGNKGDMSIKKNKEKEYLKRVEVKSKISSQEYEKKKQKIGKMQENDATLSKKRKIQENLKDEKSQDGKRK